ncbi:MAG TPA: diguanylate cyclase [Pilimelia sp.]|nr:diguanylate cyclase [Pilimelia sp.]
MVARDPLALGLIGTTLLVGVFFSARVVSLDTEIVIFWAAQPILDVLLFLIARNIAGSPGLPERKRRFWRALSFGGLVFAVGDTTQTIMAVVDPGPQAAVPGTVQSVCFVAGCGWIIWVMLNYPLAAHTPHERVRFWLDAATVMVAAEAFAWAATVQPGQVDADAGQLTQVALATSLLIVAAFAAAKLMLGGDPPVTRAAAAPVLVGIVMQGVCTALTPANLEGDWVHALLAVRLLPSVLIVFGPRLQELQLRAGVQPQPRRKTKPFSILPYVMIAGTYVMLFFTLPAQIGPQAVGVLVGVVVMSLLVVLRQVIALRDNASLLKKLDASMQQVARQERWFRSLVQHSSDVTTIMGRDGTFVYVSPSVERVLGYPPRRILGRSLMDFLHPEDYDDLRGVWHHLVTTPDATVSHQGRYRHADGSWHWLETISRNLMHEPDVAGIVSNAREVTETRELHDQLRYQASHDGLTGLANRTLFTYRLAQATAAGELTGILLIDLDEFKSINDTLGHHVGDAVLVAVAHRLGSCIRPGDTAARLGGDELAVLLPGADAATATLIAQRFLDSLIQPVRVHGHLLHVRASVGTAVDYSSDPDELLRRADAAMYTAKRQGKGRHFQATPA